MFLWVLVLVLVLVFGFVLWIRTYENDSILVLRHVFDSDSMIANVFVSIVANFVLICVCFGCALICFSGDESVERIP